MSTRTAYPVLTFVLHGDSRLAMVDSPVDASCRVTNCKAAVVPHTQRYPGIKDLYRRAQRSAVMPH